MSDPLADLATLRAQSSGHNSDPLADLSAIRAKSGAPGGASGGWASDSPQPHQQSLLGQLGNQFAAAGQGVLDTTVRPLAELHNAGMAENNKAPGTYGWGVLKAFGRGIVGSMRGEEDAAADDFSSGHYISGIGHHVAASIPIIGPLTAEIGGGLGTGLGESIGGDVDSTTLARTGGKVGGLLAADMLRGGVAKLKEIAPPAPGESGGVVADALEGSHGPGGLPFKDLRAKQFKAQSASYEKAAADLTKQHEADAAAAAQKSRAQYGTNLKNFKGANERLVRAAREEIAKVAPLSSPEDIGAATGDSIKSVKGTAQALYNQVTEATAPTKVSKTVVTQRPTGILDAQGKQLTTPQTSQQIVNEGGVQVDLTGQKAIAQRYLDSLAERPYDTPGAADISAQLQRIVNGPDSASFAGASGSASDLLDAARKLDEPLPKLRGKINAEIAGELKRSTNAAVADQAPEVAASLDHANRLWVDLHRPGVVELLDRAENAPETAHQWLSEPSTSLRDLRDAKKVLSPAVWRSMNARALADELDTSIKTRPIDPADKTLPFTQVPKLSDGLTNKLNEWDRSGKLAEMFPSTANALRQIAKTAGELRKPAQVKPVVTALDVKGTLGDAPQLYKPEPGLGSWLTDIAMGGYGLRSLFTNNWAGMGKTAAAGAVTYGIAKLLTDPVGANLMLRYVKAQAAGNTGLAASLGTKLAALATREQRIGAQSPKGDEAPIGVRSDGGALAAGPPLPSTQPVIPRHQVTSDYLTRPENADWLENTPPSRILPVGFGAALETTVAMPRHVGVLDKQLDQQYSGAVGHENASNGWIGLSGRGLIDPTHSPGEIDSLVSRGSGVDWSGTLYHELGHQAFDGGDIPKKAKDQLSRHYNKLLTTADETHNDDPNDTIKSILSQGSDEFFPELMRLYVSRPSLLKTEDPEGYGIMRSIFKGREYIRRGASGSFVNGPPAPDKHKYDFQDTPPGDYPPPENADMLASVHPKKIIPERFKVARSADVAMPRYVGALDSPDEPSAREGKPWHGFYSGGGEAWPGQPSGTPGIVVSRLSGNQYIHNLYHEFGHGAWEELTPEEQDAFEQHTRKLWARTDYDENGRVERALRRNTDHGTGAGGEFFPEMFSMYITDPSALKREDPSGYQLLKKMFGGREYIRK